MNTMEKKYIQCKFEESIANNTSYKHAAHCMIFTRFERKVLECYPAVAAVMMQLRFDGCLGFPGGLIDVGEDIITGLRRELAEEINLDANRFTITAANHVCSHIHEAGQLMTHFFALELEVKDFEELEHLALTSRDFGDEVFGVIRVPLHTMKDGFRGFPTFLRQRFIGNARDQLLEALKQQHVIPDEEITKAAEKSQHFPK